MTEIKNYKRYLKIINKIQKTRTKNNKNLLCHYCGHKGNLKRKCDNNDICDFIFSGPGVERIAEELKKIFPNQNILFFLVIQ